MKNIRKWVKNIELPVHYIFFGFWRRLFQTLDVTSNAWCDFSHSENNIFDIIAVLVWK